MPGGSVIGKSLGLGFPGTHSRGGISDIYSRPVRSTDTVNILFGDAVFLIADSAGGQFSSTQGVIAASGTPAFANFSGVAVREVKSNLTYAPNSTVFTGYAPGTQCDVIRLGDVTVKCNVGTPTAGGAVYLRIVANGSIPAGIVGGFEAAADSTNTIALTNCQWTTGLIDSDGIAEISLMSRNK